MPYKQHENYDLSSTCDMLHRNHSLEASSISAISQQVTKDCNFSDTFLLKYITTLRG